MLPRRPVSACYNGGNYTINQALAEASAEQNLVIRGYNHFITLTAAVPQVLFNEETNRAYLILQNRGPGNVFLTFGQTPQGAALNYPSAITIGANQSYELDEKVIVDTVYLVSDQNSTIVSAIQGVWSYT